MARGPLAGAAGPGKFSVRTDGLTLPSQSYGEGKQTQEIIQGAALAKTPDVRGLPASEVRQAATGAPVTPLYSATQRPEEPITTGIAMGPGAGPEVLGMQSRDSSEYVNAYELFQNLAANPNASPSMQYLAQRIQQGF
jgi:hypothetical protein